MARAGLAAIAAEQFGDMVKAVVDVRRGIMAIGGDLHPGNRSGGVEDEDLRESLRRIVDSLVTS